MDLSSLPLMPSLDLPPAAPAAPATAPEAARPYAGTSWDTIVADDLDGCQCAACRQERQQLHARDRSASSMRQQYGASYAQPPPIGGFFDPSILSGYNSPVAVLSELADSFSGAVTGRISASQPAMANIPRVPPPVQSSRRIRGRYDFNAKDATAFGLQGVVRWREPGTMQVYDDPENGDRQWTYSEELPDGTLVDRNGRRWRPTEV